MYVSVALYTARYLLTFKKKEVFGFESDILNRLITRYV